MAKAAFDDVLSGKGADTSVLGALTSVVTGVTSEILDLASALDPMAQNLAETLGGTQLTNASIDNATRSSIAAPRTSLVSSRR